MENSSKAYIKKLEEKYQKKQTKKTQSSGEYLTYLKKNPLWKYLRP